MVGDDVARVSGRHHAGIAQGRECQAQQPGQRDHQDEIAGDGGKLRAQQKHHLGHEAVYGARRVQAAQLGGQGRRGHCGLLGGNRPVQQHHQHESQRVVDARRQTAPEGRQPQRVQKQLAPGGQRHHRAAARCGAQHLAVLLAVARDVVLAAFGIALGHLGGQQLRVAANERAHAERVAADAHQMREHLRRRQHRLGRLQAQQQALDAQDALAHLLNLELDVHRDAVLLQMRVHRVGAGAAGIQMLAKRCNGLLRAGRQAPLRLHGRAQGLEHRGQIMKAPRLARLHRHAAANAGRQANGADLADGVGERVQQRALGVVVLRGAAGARRLLVKQQLAHAAGRFLVQRAQPARVQLARKQQVNQIGLVGRIGRDRQQLLAQAARQLAQESRARRKAQIRQQRRLIRGGDEHRPPAPPALPPVRAHRHRVQQRTHAREHGLHLVFAGVLPIGAAAHPVQQANQPQMPLHARRAGIQRFQMPHQFKLRTGHSSTRQFIFCHGQRW